MFHVLSIPAANSNTETKTVPLRLIYFVVSFILFFMFYFEIIILYQIEKKIILFSVTFQKRVAFMSLTEIKNLYTPL